MYYKVTYNQPGFKFYIVVVPAQFADSKHHAIEQVFAKHSAEFPNRAFYKAKLLK